MTADKRRGVQLLFATTALLPFAILPLELGLGRIALGVPLAALILLVGIRHRAFDGGIVSGVELAAAGLGLWIVARLVLLGPASGEPVAWELLIRECGALLAGVVMFRLARRNELKQTILTALGVGFVLLIILEAYQLLAGLPALQSAGYTAENGFFYYTADGTYRPFGTFTGPTTFGTFLAMLGMFLAFSRGRGALVLVGVITTAAVIITNTRAAWLGVGFALAALVFGSREARGRSSTLLIPAFVTLGLTVLIWPGLFVAVWERLMSATDPSDTSRQGRLALWEGVMDATSRHGVVFDGFGSGDWVRFMFHEVGYDVVAFGHAHSNYFQEWFRYGVVGMAFFIVLVFAMLVTASRGVRAQRRYAFGAVSAVVTFAVDSAFNNSLSSLNFVVLTFLLLGMGAAAPQYARGSPPSLKRPTSRRPRVPAGAVRRGAPAPRRHPTLSDP